MAPAEAAPALPPIERRVGVEPRRPRLTANARGADSTAKGTGSSARQIDAGVARIDLGP